MQETEKKTGSRIGLVIRILVFLSLALALFVYLNLACMTKGSTQSRGTFDAFYDLENNSVDVVLVGASSVSRFFVSPVAFHDYGLAAYEFGPAGSPIFFRKSVIEEIERTQSPSLYVIDLHGVQRSLDAIAEGDIRRTLDNINLFSSSRYHMAQSALQYVPNNNETLFDYLVPIAMYHSRLVQGKLTKRDFLLKTPYNRTQGFTLSDHTLTQNSIKEPQFVEGQIELEDATKKALEELLDYCDTLDADVLFIEAPGSYSETQYKSFNAALSYVQSRGYPTLNFNTSEVFDGTGLVWETDFYNAHHTNYLGALKYTDYLSKYIVEHYDLPDRRGDKTYAAWEKGYSVFQKFTNDGIKFSGEGKDESA